MNRRNFILGLGTAATLSGAASVTGASISGSVDADASFQVIAENDLVVQRNPDINTVGGEIDNSTSDNYVNTTVGYVDNEGTLNTTQGSGVRDVSTPQLTVNDQEDGSLEIALASPNEVIPDTDGSNDPYDSDDTNGISPLQIANNGGENKQVTIDYTYGDKVQENGGGTTSGNGTLDSGDVADLFAFSIGEQQISPDRADPDSPGDAGDNTNQVQVDAGTSEKVDFSINYTEGIADDIAQAASATGSYDFGQNAFAAVELLTTVTFAIGDGS